MLRLTASLAGASVALLAATVPAVAQAPAASGTAPTTRVEASGRATTQISVTTRGSGAAPAERTVRIDYGQPHARGRAVAGGLVPYDEVWRTGANTSTTLTTAVDLQIGDLRVPSGSYSLYSQLTRNGWTLIVNRQTGQWGTQYDAAQDLGRVPMTVQTLAAPAESFTMTLVPSGSEPLAGSLVLSWGTVQGSAPWRVLP